MNRIMNLGTLTALLTLSATFMAAPDADAGGSRSSNMGAPSGIAAPSGGVRSLAVPIASGPAKLERRVKGRNGVVYVVQYSATGKVVSYQTLIPAPVR